MTELDLAAVRARIERAHTEVGDIASEGSPRRWRMSIPARPDRDSDLIISAALADAEKLATEVEQLRAQRDAALALHQPDDEGRCRRCVYSWADEETETSPCGTASALAPRIDAEKPEPKQFEVWEFDDGEIGWFSWTKDPDGNLALAACTDGPGWRIWAPWHNDNERQPMTKIEDTPRRPGEVSRPYTQGTDQ